MKNSSFTELSHNTGMVRFEKYSMGLMILSRELTRGRDVPKLSCTERTGPPNVFIMRSIAGSWSPVMAQGATLLQRALSYAHASNTAGARLLHPESPNLFTAWPLCFM